MTSAASLNDGPGFQNDAAGAPQHPVNEASQQSERTGDNGASDEGQQPAGQPVPSEQMDQWLEVRRQYHHSLFTKLCVGPSTAGRERQCPAIDLLPAQATMKPSLASLSAWRSRS